MDPIKALGKAGLLGKMVNNLDGGVEMVDDIDDHWTSKNHKDERRFVMEDLQDLAADKSVRITILSGDVHLAAVGQFYSNPKLDIVKNKDFRYIPNVISSAIVNTPPPDLLADTLNKRNKVHIFDQTRETFEDMIPMFTNGVDGKPRNNQHLLPHRNWCSIREYVPGRTPPSTPPPEENEATPLGTSFSSASGFLQRLSSTRGRGPAASRADVPPDSADRARPPVSSGRFRRVLTQRNSSSDPPKSGSRSSSLLRSLSLGRGDSPHPPRGLGFFRRRRSLERHGEGGGDVNGNLGDEELEYDGQPATATAAYPGKRRPSDPVGLRGGAGSSREYGSADESFFTTRPSRRGSARSGRWIDERDIASDAEASEPATRRNARAFRRTPTTMSQQQMRAGAERYAVDLQGGLDICINAEVNARDPAGITVPYRLLVPQLAYEYHGEEMTMPFSAPRRATPAAADADADGEYDDDDVPVDHQGFRGGLGGGLGGGLKRLLSGRKGGSHYGPTPPPR